MRRKVKRWNFSSIYFARMPVHTVHTNLIASLHMSSSTLVEHNPVLEGEYIIVFIFRVLSSKQ